MRLQLLGYYIQSRILMSITKSIHNQVRDHVVTGSYCMEGQNQNCVVYHLFNGQLVLGCENRSDVILLDDNIRVLMHAVSVISVNRWLRCKK